VDERDDQEEAGAARTDQPPQPEDDAPLVLLHDPHGGAHQWQHDEQDDRDQDSQVDQRVHLPVTPRALLGSEPARASRRRPRRWRRRASSVAPRRLARGLGSAHIAPLSGPAAQETRSVGRNRSYAQLRTYFIPMLFA